MTNISYKKELFDLIKELTSINSQILFTKEMDKVIVTRSDAEKTIFYSIECPKEYFDFPGKEINFYNYVEFYDFFRALKNPEISIEDIMIELKDDSSKIEYRMADAESVAKGPKKLCFGTPDVEFDMSANKITSIVKLKGLFGSDQSKKIRIYGDKDSVSIELGNGLSQKFASTSCEKTFEVSSVREGFDDKFDFYIFSSHLDMIPSKRDYKVSLRKQGDRSYVRFSLVDNSGIDFNIYTSGIRS